MLRELIPGDLVKTQSSNEWKRSIIAAYNHDAGKCYRFLKIMYLIISSIFVFKQINFLI